MPSIHASPAARLLATRPHSRVPGLPFSAPADDGDASPLPWLDRWIDRFCERLALWGDGATHHRLGSWTRCGGRYSGNSVK